ASASVQLQGVLKLLIPVGELEENLVGEFLVFEMGWLERLEEVQVEVPRWLGRGPLVGSPEEKIASTGNFVFPPLDLVFPNLVARDIRRLVGQFQHTDQCVKVVLIQLRVGESLGFVLDFGVMIDGLLKVQVVL